MFSRTYFFAALATFAACVPQIEFNDGTDAAASRTDASDADASTDAVARVDAPSTASDAGVDAATTSDAGVDAATTSDAGVDAATASDGGFDAPLDTGDASDSGGISQSVLLAAAVNAPGAVDGSAPWENDTVSVTRTSATSKFVLASTPDGLGGLYVDDNIHVLVAPTIGTAADQYYEFWSGYPCPAASTTMPPGAPGGGNSPPIDVSFLFSADTTSPQKVTLEFWHCVAHGPSHGKFYLVEK